MLLNEFKSAEEIYEYLESNKSIIRDGTVEDMKDHILSIFASPITDDPKVMMHIYSWLDLETDVDIAFMASNHIRELNEVDLSLYKFKILTGFRGPLNFVDFILHTKNLLENDQIQLIAKHKDFPKEIKKMLFEKTQDTDYLPVIARDVFIF